MPTPIPSLTLNDGHTICQLGFGGDQIPPEQTEAAFTIALEAGYRHIDTAAAYLNEAETGAAIAASSLPRDELFVTTKVSNNDQGRDRTRGALESSLSKLGLDHLDLYLIHWPAPSRGLYEETWLMLIDLQREGLVRGALVVRKGKGGRRREVGMDRWAWQQLRPWLDIRAELPIGTFLCVIHGPTAGRHWEQSAARKQLRRVAVSAGVRRRFAPHH